MFDFLRRNYHRRQAQKIADLETKLASLTFELEAIKYCYAIRVGEKMPGPFQDIRPSVRVDEAIRALLDHLKLQLKVEPATSQRVSLAAIKAAEFFPGMQQQPYMRRKDPEQPED